MEALTVSAFYLTGDEFSANRSIGCLGDHFGFYTDCRELELWKEQMSDGLTAQNLLRSCAAMVEAGLKPSEYTEVLGWEPSRHRQARRKPKQAPDRQVRCPASGIESESG